MSLYKKQLNNIGELRKERAALKKQSRKLNKQPAGISDLVKQKISAATSESPRHWLSAAVNLLAGKDNIAAAAIPLVFNLVRRTPLPKLARSAATGLVGGYLKWQAISLGFRLARKILKAKKKETEA